MASRPSPRPKHPQRTAASATPPTTTCYAAATPEEAARLYEEDVGDPCDDGYPREVSAAELDRSIPEFGEDEQPTGEMTTMRTWLEEASPGFLCGAE